MLDNSRARLICCQISTVRIFALKTGGGAFGTLKRRLTPQNNNNNNNNKTKQQNHNNKNNNKTKQQPTNRTKKERKKTTTTTTKRKKDWSANCCVCIPFKSLFVSIDSAALLLVGSALNRQFDSALGSTISSSGRQRSKRQVGT